MPLEVGTLADGQLPNTKTTLYTVPPDKSAHVFIILANSESGTAYTVNLYLKRSGGTSRRIIGSTTDLAAKGSMEMPSNLTGIKLSEGDIIEGDASVAAKVDYTIYGGEE